MFFLIKLLDNSQKWQWFFQEPATLIMENIITIHIIILFFLIIVVYVVLWFIFIMIKYWSKQFSFNNTYKSWKHFTHNKWLEILWTIILTIFLIRLCIKFKVCKNTKNKKTENSWGFFIYFFCLKINFFYFCERYENYFLKFYYYIYFKAYTEVLKNKKTYQLLFIFFIQDYVYFKFLNLYITMFITFMYYWKKATAFIIINNTPKITFKLLINFIYNFPTKIYNSIFFLKIFCIACKIGYGRNILIYLIIKKRLKNILNLNAQYTAIKTENDLFFMYLNIHPVYKLKFWADYKNKFWFFITNFLATICTLLLICFIWCLLCLWLLLLLLLEFL